MSLVLITGGSGLIGTALTRSLLAHGHAVRHLSRKAGRRDDGVNAFAWDPSRGTIDAAAFDGVEYIVHLSGAPVAERRWTRARLKVLDDSRVGAALLIRKASRDHGVALKGFISASGINYYGAVTSEHVFDEEDPPGTDVIGQLTRRWEDAAFGFADLCRVVVLRTPLVLAREGGALPKLARIARWGLAAPLGSGRQWMPWVHINDLVRLYLIAIANETMKGAYNVATSSPVTNREFMRALAHATHRWMLPFPVPGFLLRLALGGVAGLLLEGSRASNAKLLATGFCFQHVDLQREMRILLQ